MAQDSDETFYIGYLPQAPPRLARWLRRWIWSLFLLVAGTAVLLSGNQAPPEPGYFEYGIRRTFEGWVSLRPEPHLLAVLPGGEAGTSYLLVDTGKHGAHARMARFEGRHVRLEGSLVFRDHYTLIELADSPIQETESGGTPPVRFLAEDGPGPEVLVRGEIVDSKCFLGVMKPGRGKTHRACATRCISGGIPPVLALNGPTGLDCYLLVAADGSDLRHQILEYVAEPVEIPGKLQRYGDTAVLLIDPMRIRRLP